MSKSLRKAYEITNVKISFVSLVDKAANKRTFLLKKEEGGKASFSTYGRILKADSESHFVTGVVYEPMVEDTHGNYMSEDEIIKAAHWYLKNKGRVDLQHSFVSMDGADVVESWVAKSDFDIDGEPVTKGTWMMTVEVTDPDVWSAIEKGEITGFSMGGLGDYSEEDVTLDDNVSKTADSTGGEKKGLLKQLATALGFNMVEKGAMAELYEQRSKGTQFWDAMSAMEDSLRHYDYVSDRYIYETDEEKIREVLQDFSNIITSILTGSEPIAKAIQTDRPVDKAGKAMSSKNLEALHGIRDSLDTFLKAFEPQDDPEDGVTPDDDKDKDKADDKDGGTGGNEDDKQVKKEDMNMTQQEVEKMVSAAVEKAMAAQQGQPQETEPVTKNDGGEVTAETIQKMVEAAVTKALEPTTKQEQQPETLTAEAVEKMVGDAVRNAVEPILKARGIPTHLDGTDGVTKSAEEQHYLHGFI